MRLQRLNPGFVVMAAVQQLSKGVHDGKTCILNALAGCVITLPPATGSGCRLRFIRTVATTSVGDVIKVQNATDVMIGSALVNATAGGTGFPTVNTGTVATNSDTITTNRTTTGGATAGDLIEMEDIAPNLWVVEANLNGSGTVATPFSATV